MNPNHKGGTMKVKALIVAFVAALALAGIAAAGGGWTWTDHAVTGMSDGNG
jgi:hypothetical protein